MLVNDKFKNYKDWNSLLEDEVVLMRLLNSKDPFPAYARNWLFKKKLEELLK